MIITTEIALLIIILLRDKESTVKICSYIAGGKLVGPLSFYYGYSSFHCQSFINETRRLGSTDLKLNYIPRVVYIHWNREKGSVIPRDDDKIKLKWYGTFPAVTCSYLSQIREWKEKRDGESRLYLFLSAKRTSSSFRLYGE